MKINIKGAEFRFFQPFYSFWNEMKKGITD